MRFGVAWRPWYVPTVACGRRGHAMAVPGSDRENHAVLGDDGLPAERGGGLGPDVGRVPQRVEVCQHERVDARGRSDLAGVGRRRVIDIALFRLGVVGHGPRKVVGVRLVGVPLVDILQFQGRLGVAHDVAVVDENIRVGRELGHRGQRRRVAGDHD